MVPGAGEPAAVLGDIVHLDNLELLGSAALQTSGTAAAGADPAALANMTVSVGDLHGTDIGDTTGEQVVMYATADGQGWFVDPNSTSSTAFNAPQNGNIWTCTSQSPAYGKMDLFTAMLHEFGHALGLQHSSNPQDVMYASLDPGVRRLPTVADLFGSINITSSTNGVSSSDNVVVSAGLTHALSTTQDVIKPAPIVTNCAMKIDSVRVGGNERSRCSGSPSSTLSNSSSLVS